MKLKHTKLQLFMELIGLFLIIGMIVFIVMRWDTLPQMIPGHYNAMGEVDRWGSKSEILILPAVGVLLYILITVVSLFPKLWNVPFELTEKNKAQVYQCMKNLLIILKIEMSAVFFFIIYNDATAKNLPAVSLPVFLVVIFGTIIISVVRLHAINKKYKESK